MLGIQHDCYQTYYYKLAQTWQICCLRKSEILDNTALQTKIASWQILFSLLRYSPTQTDFFKESFEVNYSFFFGSSQRAHFSKNIIKKVTQNFDFSFVTPTKSLLES